MLANTVTARATLDVPSAREHTLKVYMVDPGVVLDKVVVHAPGLELGYLGPSERRREE